MKTRKKGKRRRFRFLRLIMAALCVFIGLLMIGYVKTTYQSKTYGQITAEDLTRYFDQGKVQKIVEFIEYAKDRNDKRELVEKAVDLIAQKNLKEGLKGLETIFYKESDQSYISSTIIKAMNKNGVQFESLDKACDYYVKDRNSGEVKDGMAEMIRRYDTSLVEKYFKEKMADTNRSGSSEELFNYIESLEKLGLNVSMDIKKLKEDLEQLKKLEDEIKNFQAEADSIKQKLDVLKKQVPDGKVFTLHAYAVGKVSSNRYEIAFLEKDNFFGEIPSKNHALLDIKETELQPKNIFDLHVIQTGTVDVELSKEEEGFNSRWNLYREVTDAELQKIEEYKDTDLQYNNVLAEIDKVKGEMEKFQKEVDGLLEIDTVSDDGNKNT